MKLKEFQSILKEKKIDFALFFNLIPAINPNLFYFSGYQGVGALIIGQKKSFLLVPEMEYERAKENKIKNVHLLKNKKLFEDVLKKIKKNKIKKRKIGIDKAAITVREYSAFKKCFKESKAVDVSDMCNRLRETKTEEEVEIIKEACRITDEIFNKCIANFKQFKTEADVAAFLEQETRKKGCCFAFQPIVASGASSSQPHYETRNVKLKKGFCVIDFGIRHKGYCSDMTRTIYLGKPSKKEIMLYHLLLNTQKETIKKAEKESVASRLFQFAKNGMGKYNKNFIHGLGHGIGIEVHELPNLRENSKDKLKDSSIFTVEPGIYFPSKFGVRIEDTVFLKKGRPEVLTKFGKYLKVITLT